MDNPADALKDAAICFIFTEWEEIKNIPAVDFKNLMRIPLVYDGRNVFDVKTMKDADIEYYSIGR